MSESRRYEPYVARVLREWPGDASFHQSVEGTMVFVDISGFTAMSERLAKRGKVGAEEVVAVLNNTFTALLTIADRWGGDLLKFGGDALLLFFTGNDHTARATAAALGMRHELRTAGKLTTSAGKVALRMSVGVHTGAFDFFLVGDRHRELIVAGPAATETVNMEGTAQAGQILLSAAAAHGLTRDHIGAAQGGGFLLRNAPRAAPPATVVEDADRDLTQFVPEPLRPVLGTSQRDGEHRRATIAFIKFTGTDDMLATHGADAVAAALAELVEVTQEEAAQFGVTFLASDIDANGGKLILTAGVPTASDSDEERLLRTARAIVDRVRSIPIKVGVNRGYIFSADVGASFRRAYTVIGDAVNLAARVMTRADPGEIVSTIEPIERSATEFETEALEPFMVKGKKEPVHAFAVGPMLGFRQTEALGDMALVGRETELAQLTSEWETARAGQGRFVQVLGPAGVGKTRLLAEFTGRAAPKAVHTVACEQYESSTPYSMARRLLRSVLDIPLAADPAEAGASLMVALGHHRPLRNWAPLLAVPLDATVAPTAEAAAVDDRFRKNRTHEVTVELLEALLPGEVLLAIEDAQWIDDVSGALLETLLHRLDKRRWLLLSAARPGGQVPRKSLSPDVTIDLDNLPAADAERLAETASADMRVAPHLLRTAVERSAGNPLFLLELVQAAGSGADELPDSVEAVVTARIDRLDPDLRTLLRYGATVGSTVDLALLADSVGDAVPLVGDPDAWAQLGDFLERQSDGRYVFQNSVIRDVAYEGLPYRTRREVHARIGDVIRERFFDSPDVAARLSLHYSRGERHQEAWEYSVAAGRAASDKYANVEAIEYYRRALLAAHNLGTIDPDEIVQTAEALGDAAEIAGLYEEADRGYAQARKKAAGRPEPTARLMLKQGMLRERAGKYSNALRWISRALKYPLGPDGADTAVALRVSYAGVRFRQARYRDCIEWCEKALDDAYVGANRAEVAHALRLLDHSYSFFPGEKPADFAGRALETYKELGDLVGQANVLNNMGVEAYHEGRWDEALDFYEQSKAARETAGDVVGAAMTANNIGEVLSDQGKLDEAEANLRAAQRGWGGANYEFGVAVAGANLARVIARRGDTESALAMYAESLSMFEKAQSEFFIVETKYRMAEAHMFAGEHEMAHELSEEALSRSQNQSGLGMVRAAALRVDAYTLLQSGQTEAGLRRLEQSLELARSVDADFEVARTLKALSRVVELTGAEDEWDTARFHEIFDRLGVVARPEVPLPA